MNADHYEHLIGQTRASIKVQRSEFIGIAFPVVHEDAFEVTLDAIRRELYDATHHCWAWRRFDDGVVRERSADAGEPSGTAGRPILQAIEDDALLDSAVVVARYYGGVKLGTGGLARAYRDAAREVLAAAPRERRYLYASLTCRPGFDRMNLVYRMVDPPDVVLRGEHFDPDPRMVLEVRKSRLDAIAAELTEHRIEHARE